MSSFRPKWRNLKNLKISRQARDDAIFYAISPFGFFSGSFNNSATSFFFSTISGVILKTLMSSFWQIVQNRWLKCYSIHLNRGLHHVIHLSSQVFIPPSTPSPNSSSITPLGREIAMLFATICQRIWMLMRFSLVSLVQTFAKFRISLYWLTMH